MAAAVTTVSPSGARGGGLSILRTIREKMAAQQLDALLVPSSDPHNSEYVAPWFKCREFVSNFSGSAGTCLITATDALLWTDGRYWLQAEATMYEGWRLQKEGLAETPSIEAWIASNIGKASKVGVDPSLVTLTAWERWSKSFNPVAAPNIVPPLMRKEPPQQPGCAVVPTIFRRPEAFCGCTMNEKVQLVAAEARRILSGGAAATTVAQLEDAWLAVTALDDIAWLLNLRGGGIVPFNPVFYAYALIHITTHMVLLFVDTTLLTEEAASYLADAGRGDTGPPDTSDRKRRRSEQISSSSSVHLLPYDAILQATSATSPPLEMLKGGVVIVDENQISEGLRHALLHRHGVGRLHRCPLNPVTKLKAIKNAVEIEGFQASHVRDGIALTRFLAWLDAHVTEAAATSKSPTLTEWQAAETLEQFRRSEDAAEDHGKFVSLSFESISATGPNAAVIHYSPTEACAAVVIPHALYLIDSGAQYLDGTTDVTRTVAFRCHNPTAEEKTFYTLVLKGHIAIQRCVFPKHVTGHRIDAFARAALWQCGYDYAHGTGHGVGSFLNVHEGPQGIHTRPTATGATLEAGMIVSNEPGYYAAGKFGIRIENLEVVIPVDTHQTATVCEAWAARARTAIPTPAGSSLGFHTLTVVPLCRDLIDASLLTEVELTWVNTYHRRVLETLLPRIESRGDTVAVSYLQYHCAPI